MKSYILPQSNLYSSNICTEDKEYKKMRIKKYILDKGELPLLVLLGGDHEIVKNERDPRDL